MKKIVFTGGGTLGHVMPNLYLIEELKKDYECFYIGSSGIEKDKVKNVAEYYEIPAVKLIRGKILKNLKIPFVLINSILKAKSILKEIKPDVVFSKGGYVSLPICIAARMLKIPLIAHESDSSFGLANKIILKTCNKMCVNFKNLQGKNKKIVYTGPIFSKSYESKEKDFSNLHIDKTKPTLLIVGGSLGSKKINENIFAILKDLLKDFNVIHITGKGNNKVKSYENYNSFEMTNDMVNLYNIADFVIGRSGAGVTAECFYKHLPMILIPLENKATRGDQTLNAKYYEKLGVAKIIKESELTPTKLLNEINDFHKNLKIYKESYNNQKQINGKQVIVDLINEYAIK
ncbi:MAG: UDP-N-acetylglucosamine--N-acetylmuramyl-(pentapeptide) pyrophosphoryl-undecaprenol N-acetylglucosamine transferase [Clostridia bacterium]|nr:UDP-N-acetylglucosamine--N-acetylmuramyl-(pentapeptide) pyrophosphoryl-undecaprenol N-acetylglucosamine transferase [Clostridia bacterium]